MSPEKPPQPKDEEAQLVITGIEKILRHELSEPVVKEIPRKMHRITPDNFIEGV